MMWRRDGASGRHTRSEIDEEVALESFASQIESRPKERVWVGFLQM